MIHSPSQRELVKNTILGAITAAAIHGNAVDRSGYTRALLTAVANPTGAGTTETFIFEDSPDNATWTTVAPVTAFAIVETAGTNTAGNIEAPALQIADVDLTHRQRYIRMTATGAGASAAGQVCCNIHLYNPEYAPVPVDAAATYGVATTATISTGHDNAIVSY